MESLLPPPFNLIEDIFFYTKKLFICKGLKTSTKKCKRDDLEMGFIKNTNPKQNRKKVLTKLVCRYKFKNYIKPSFD